MSENFNPHLQSAILEVVENQLAGNDPPETKKTYERLGGSRRVFRSLKRRQISSACVNAWVR